MGSTRLPGKSLAELGDRPVIDWVVERAALAHAVDEVVVATSSDQTDDALAAHLEARGVRVVRGSNDDVLARFADVLDTIDHDAIVRVTGDCPFVQPELIDRALAQLVDDVDYVYTGHDGRVPRGFDVEAVRRSALRSAAVEAVDPVEREHVTPFVARRPERFPAVPLAVPAWASRPEFRLTLDEADDLALLRAVVDGMGVEPRTLDGGALIEFLDAHPDVVGLNRHVEHNTEH